MVLDDVAFFFEYLVGVGVPCIRSSSSDCAALGCGASITVTDSLPLLFVLNHCMTPLALLVDAGSLAPAPESASALISVPEVFIYEGVILPVRVVGSTALRGGCEEIALFSEIPVSMPLS